MPKGTVLLPAFRDLQQVVIYPLHFNTSIGYETFTANLYRHSIYGRPSASAGGDAYELYEPGEEHLIADEYVSAMVFPTIRAYVKWKREVGSRNVFTGLSEEDIP